MADAGRQHGNIEILAPAGNMESLKAAVYCGASAVYIGGKGFNARRNAANFSDDELREAVTFCHVRGVSVYQTVNTIVFGGELRELEQTLHTAADCGVDGVIAQDLAVSEMVLRCVPTLPLHASTQMSVHNLDGVKALEQLGFSRVVLARELSRDEIAFIATRTPLDVECFVHGALCMCVSGQCYLSAMIGGRSGNRGLCAQPCRLPFSSHDSEYALSLRDLSLVRQIPDMASIGVKSLKIEGRLKRPEYVAAAVTACRQSLEGETPDISRLRAVFSRSGFTDGYYAGALGDGMFGVRAKGDVQASLTVLKELESLYSREVRRVPIHMRFEMKADAEMRLYVSDRDGNTVNTSGTAPEKALNSPATPEKVRALLEKTGGTPYFVDTVKCELGEGLVSPSSSVNAMRRESLDKLTEIRARRRPHVFQAYDYSLLAQEAPARRLTSPLLRARVQNAGQLSAALFGESDMVIIPCAALGKADPALIGHYKDKIYAEIPRIFFGDSFILEKQLVHALALGVTHGVAGNLGGLELAKRLGFSVHGDFGLNIANPIALDVLAGIGVQDVTLSFECGVKQALSARGKIPRGIIGYGYLPLMLTRNYPAGTKNSPEADLIDRLGNKFPLKRLDGVSELYNMTPLVLSDKLGELAGFDFITLYFTFESARECLRVLGLYKSGGNWDGPKTRGLYYRGVK